MINIAIAVLLFIMVSGEIGLLLYLVDNYDLNGITFTVCIIIAIALLVIVILFINRFATSTNSTPTRHHLIIMPNKQILIL